MKSTGFREQFTNIADACALAQAIVDTVGEPVLVLDRALRVVAASRSFYSTFKVSPEDTQGSLLYELGDGQWDLPKLRVLLEKIIPEQGEVESYEVEHEFPGIGQRTMRLNARQVFYEGGSHATILLSIEDVTNRRILEREKDDLLREKDELLREKDVLFEELQHRISNSLQVIASIILMKAKTVQSEETRLIYKIRTSGSVGCRSAEATPCTRDHRICRSCALPFKVVQSSRNFNDWRQSPNHTESGRRTGYCYVPSGREHWLDRHRTRYECAQACVSRRESRR